MPKSKDFKSRVEVRLSRLQNIKNTKHNHTNYEIYIYEICFKNKVFIFSKVIVGYKNEN